MSASDINLKPYVTKKESDKGMRRIVTGEESGSVWTRLTVSEPCAITGSYWLWKPRAGPNGHQGLIMTTLLLAYSIIHDFLITAAIRNRGTGEGVRRRRRRRRRRKITFVAGWQRGRIRWRQLAEQQFTLILCCVWWMQPARGWAADEGGGLGREEQGGEGSSSKDR